MSLEYLDRRWNTSCAKVLQKVFRAFTESYQSLSEAQSKNGIPGIPSTRRIRDFCTTLFAGSPWTGDLARGRRLPRIGSRKGSRKLCFFNTAYKVLQSTSVPENP